jgi:hypothetical protein
MAAVGLIWMTKWSRRRAIRWARAWLVRLMTFDVVLSFLWMGVQPVRWVPGESVGEDLPRGLGRGGGDRRG